MKTIRRKRRLSYNTTLAIVIVLWLSCLALTQSFLIKQMQADIDSLESKAVFNPDWQKLDEEHSKQYNY